MIGREQETEDLVQRLHERRLVTVTGAGGIGKTALARHVASIVGPEFPMGAVEVDLTRVDDDGAVFEAIAGQLGYADFASLMDSPSDQPALIVLDNCEHVLDGAADAVDQMLAACRMPTILTTSRSPLDLDDESIVSITPLATTAPGAPGDIDDAAVAADSPAYELFVARAQDHGVEIGDDERDLAADVIRRLDGVPLAIEIAAARLRSVGLVELVGELEHSPHALARRRHRGQENHRSVSDLVDWSYRLLPERIRSAFRALSVFSGPFDSELGRFLLDVDSDEWDEVVDVLANASLVVLDRRSEGTRYRLLHPVRAVAAHLLDEAGDTHEVRDRLVDAVIARTTGIIRGGPDGWRSTDLHQLLDLYDDATASIRWLMANDTEAERAMVLVAVLWGVIHNAHTGEIHELGEAVIENWPPTSSPRWPNAAATVATCRFLHGDPVGAIELAERALPLASGSRSAPALILRVIAQSRRAAGDALGARDGFRAAADAAEERGAHGLTFELRTDEGLALAETGDLDAGLGLIERILDESGDAGAGINRVWARAARATLLLRRDGPDALDEIEATLADARALDYPAGVSFSLRTAARAHLANDDLARAADRALELLHLLLASGGLDEMRDALDVLAQIDRRAGGDSWPDLVATARAMPMTSFISPTDEDLDALGAPHGGRALSTREAYTIGRHLLLRILGDDPSASATTDPDAAEADDRRAPTTDRDSTDGATASLVHEGDVWRVDFGATTLRVKASKGMNDLATLLGSPDREISVLDLTGSTAAVGSSTEDELIDDEARRRYEERVRELQTEIDDAEAMNDIARSDRAREELDAIVDHLTAALGLGGRSRRTSGAAERARQAVTQRLRSTLRRLGQLDDGLGDHLSRTISTGTYCAYRPEPGVTWRVER